MKFSLEQIKDWYRNLYSSQDSKYFIATASKLTLVPTISFGIVFYSLWTIMEMNFNFFVANGFASGDLFKEAFYDQIFGDIAEYVPYLMAIIAGVFMTGLFISWLVLRSFEQIENFSLDSIENPQQDFEVQGLNKNKIINQVARIFFKYLQICKLENKRPRFRLPKKLQNLNSPPFDKVFFLQYGLIVSILCLITNLTLFAFTNEIYQQIINGGIEVLPSDKNITAFLGSQQDILFNIYAIAIATNIALYFLISKNIIKNVDGVSFGFARDMLRIINGEHTTRLRPRFADPGKRLANSINEYLDDIFPEDENEFEHESVQEALDTSYESLAQQHHQDQEFDQEEYETVAQEEFFDEIDDQTNVIAFEEPIAKVPVASEVLAQDDLPPAFIQEKQVVGGEKVFHITTPDGLKVENVDAEMLLKIVKETKK